MSQRTIPFHTKKKQPKHRLTPNLLKYRIACKFVCVCLFTRIYLYISASKQESHDREKEWCVKQTRVKMRIKLIIDFSFQLNCVLSSICLPIFVSVSMFCSRSESEVVFYRKSEYEFQFLYQKYVLLCVFSYISFYECSSIRCGGSIVNF